MMEIHRTRLAIITACRIVDANTQSLNSYEDRHERKRGKIKRAKDVRDEMLK